VGGGAVVADGFLTGLAPHLTVVRFGSWWLPGRFFVGVGGGFHGGPCGSFVVVDLYPDPNPDLLGGRFAAAVVQIRGG